MTTTINASTSSGLVNSADNSGVLALQTANTTALTLDTSQNATFAGSVKTNTLTSAASTALTLQSAGTTAVTVTTAQNVGIGTASPAQKLHVSDTTTSTVKTRTEASTGYVDVGMGGNSGVFDTTATDGIRLRTSGNDRLAIDTSGNVGIGTSSPSTYAKLAVTGYVTVSSVNYTARFTDGVYNTLTIGHVSGVTNLFSDAALAFGSGNTERMRIDSSGNLQIGTTSNPQSTRLTLKYGTSANWAVGPTNNSSVFFVMNDGATGVQLTSGNQSWAAQSDERVKTDLVPIENGLAKVATLRAVVGKLKKDESGRRLPFLIAQDVQAVLPEAVDTGEDEDATLSLRYSDVIPLLVASIKELKAINDTQAETINALTARVVALEGK